MTASWSGGACDQTHARHCEIGRATRSPTALTHTNGKTFSEHEAREIYQRGVQDGRREAKQWPSVFEYNVNLDDEPSGMRSRLPARRGRSGCATRKMSLLRTSWRAGPCVGGEPTEKSRQNGFARLRESQAINGKAKDFSSRPGASAAGSVPMTEQPRWVVWRWELRTNNVGIRIGPSAAPGAHRPSRIRQVERSATPGEATGDAVGHRSCRQC